jgi:hypothetical protein
MRAAMDGKTPDDPRDERPARRWPAGLLGMLAIVAAFESYVAAHGEAFSEFSAADWRLTTRAAHREAREAEILCFGDSLLKFGLLPESIERRTGRKAFNLSVLGGQAASSYYLLRRALEAGARPRAILLDCQDLPSKPIFPDVRGLGLAPHVRCWPELLGIRDAAELAWTGRDASFFGEILARSLLPSFHARREIRSGLGQLVRKGDTTAWRQHRAQARNWGLNRGTLVMAPKAKNPTKITPDRMAEPREEWSPDPVTSEYLRKFLALASGAGIRVFWVIPPTSPEHEGLRVKTGQHAYYSKLAEDLGVEFPGLVVIDGRAPGYGRGVFIDDSHLDRVGAVAFSEDVAEALARGMSAGGEATRWVALPGFRERPAAGSVEDMDESRLAMGASKGRARR